MGITVFEFFWSTNLSKILEKRNVNLPNLKKNLTKMSTSIALLNYNIYCFQNTQNVFWGLDWCSSDGPGSGSYHGGHLNISICQRKFAYDLMLCPSARARLPKKEDS